MAQRLLDGRGLVKVDREVGIAGRAGEARDEAHVQIVQAGLHHGTLLPLDVGLHIALHEPIERLVVKDVVLAIFIEEENTAEADRVVAGGITTSKQKRPLSSTNSTAQVRLQLMRDVSPGIGFHEAACAVASRRRGCLRRHPE